VNAYYLVIIFISKILAPVPIYMIKSIYNTLWNSIDYISLIEM